MRYYRLAVIGSALSWFMLGLDLPVLHQLTHHGQPPAWNALGFRTLFTLAGFAGLWYLLRTRA
jgi:hypothetical protein